jgi:signal transduction histidine kinase
MTISDTESTAEPELAELADAIERSQNEIEERWLARIRVDANATHADLTDLKDGVGRYLQRIAQSFRDPHIDHSGTEAWNDLATEHALNRVRLGFDVEQLMHELVLLRRTLTEVLREQGFTPSGSLMERILEVIDTATAASVKRYVQARDYAARRQRAEHLGFLAHQVRSPISGALLALGHARRHQSEPEKLAPSLARVERSLDRVHKLIDEALLIESFDANAIQPTFVDSTIGDVLEDLVASAQDAAARKRLVFRADYDPAATLRTDPKLLRTALEHVIENAIKYTDDGEVSFIVQEAQDRFEFHVHDNCQGISRAELAIIFEPFRRGRSNKAGTGLGLAIVRNVVQLLGGEAHVESPGERGCHFWLTIPKPRH